MTRRPAHPLRVVAVVALAVCTCATRADDGERARIAKERAAIDARYAARERACRERFVVSSCIEDAKRERREGHDALRARQIQLDEESRRDRTAARRAELAAKAADDAAREKQRAERAASAPAPRTPRPLEPRHEPKSDGAAGTPAGAHDRPLSTGERLGVKPAQHGSLEERRAREERSRASYDARLKQAEAHRREVEQRAQERSRTHPAATPLAVPGASSAAR